jgi:hypothetical protein
MKRAIPPADLSLASANMLHKSIGSEVMEIMLLFTFGNSNK